MNIPFITSSDRPKNLRPGGLGAAPGEAGGGEDDGDHHRGKRGLRPGGAPQRHGKKPWENHGEMVEMVDLS